MLKVLLVFLLLGLTLPLSAHQAGSFVQCGSSNPLSCTFDDLLDVPVRVYNFLLTMAGIVLLAVIVWGSIRMMLFYVAEQPESELMNAKLTITRGIFGFLIVVVAYVAVNLLLNLLGLHVDSDVADQLRSFGLIQERK